MQLLVIAGLLIAVCSADPPPARPEIPPTFCAEGAAEFHRGETSMGKC